MRSLADQSVAELGGRWSVLNRQRRDHVHLDVLLARLAAGSGPGQERVLNQLARLVFPHAFAEESVLWPVLRRVLPDGDELTLRVEREHQEVNELWTSLEREAEPAARRGLIHRLAEVLREDVRDEEDVLLPRLQERVGPAGLRALGVAWEAVRRTAPTRPHPVVSRRPPGNALAALPLTVLDRSRDLLDAGARSGGKRGRAALGSASAGLAQAAGRVEQWDPLRRGERPQTHRG